MAHKHSAHFRPIRSHELVLLVVCALLGAISFAMSAGPAERTPIGSSETRFVETSASGLQIVPASCPSSPHFAGDCSSATSPTGELVLPAGTGGCTVSASPVSILNGAGQSSLLSWNVADQPLTLGFFGTPTNIVLSNVGPVSRSGSVNISPSRSTAYQLTGVYMLGVFQTGSFSCTTGVTVTNCAAGQTIQNGQCTYICPAGQHTAGRSCICDDTNLPADTNGECIATQQVCPAGFQYDPGTAQCIRINQCSLPPTCSDSANLLNQCTGAVTNCAGTYGRGWYCQAGSCRRPPPPIASISAVPSLLAPNVTTNIAWTSTNTASCSVRGSNGDGPWTGTTGTHVSSPIVSQTVFTLTCIGLDDSSVARTATINIIPNWVEQ